MSPESGRGGDAAELGPLARLRADPARAAILTDVDGTLAPIVPRPEEAAVPARASEALRRLSERYGLVGCVSGRRAEEARRLVGVEDIAYAGNHGLELLLPGESELRFDPALEGREGDAAAFLAELGPQALAEAGLRLEDKGPIQALHWRGAEDDRAAEAHAHEIGATAGRAGLECAGGARCWSCGRPAAAARTPRWTALLAADGVSAATYAGDDRTDLDAFRRLRELERDGELEAGVCVGVASDEGPAEIVEEADLTVDGPPGWLALLEALAE